MVNKSKIPQELKKKKQWIVWESITKDGEPTKVPFNPETGEPASSTDPTTWTSFKKAYKVYRNSSRDGIGFMFDSDSMIVGIDLDHCRDKKKGTLEESFSKIVKKVNSYTEVSPSGEGIHIIAKGRIPTEKNRNGNYEMYQEKRYFTFTGNYLSGTPERVKSRPNEIEEVHREYIQSEEDEEKNQRTDTNFQDYKIKETGTEQLSDQEIIEKAKNASNSNKFESLFNGSTAGYKSQSEADLALCSLLTFWTGGDPARMDSLFRQSGLMREKWDEKRGDKTYGEMTIDKALHGTTEFYNPEKHKDDIPTLDEIQNQAQQEKAEITKADAFHEWVFKNKLPEDHFISKYIDEYASQRTDAYDEYHFGVALNLLSIAAERRIKINLQPVGFYTNLWINLLGMSTIARKSTALKLGDLVLDQAGLKNKKLPDDYSPESLIDSFAEDGQRVLWNDEFNTFYSQVGKQYMQGTDSLFSKLYGNPDEYTRQLRNEEVEAEDIYFNIMASCVPSQLVENVSETEVKSGFFPRMLMIWCERPKETMPLGVINNNSMEIELGKWLSELNEFLRDNQFSKGSRDELPAVPTQEALDFYNQWVQDVENKIQESSRSSNARNFSSFLGRMKDYVVKIATLIEFGSKDFRDEIKRINDKLEEEGRRLRDDDIDTLKVSKQSFEYAIYYATKLFIPNQQEFIRQVSANESQNEIQRVYNHAKKLMDEDATVRHSRLLQNTNLLSDDFKEVISTLREMNRIELALECSNCGEYLFKSSLDGDSCPECGEELEDVSRANPKTYRVLNPEKKLSIPSAELSGEEFTLEESVISDESDLF